MTSPVLVVEGYADLRSAILAALIRRHYPCEGSPTPEDAIEKLSENSYEAILLTPTLPIRNDPVIRYLREHRPEELAHVILMTEPEQDVGESPKLVKPFSTEQLFARIPQRRQPG